MYEKSHRFPPLPVVREWGNLAQKRTRVKKSTKSMIPTAEQGSDKKLFRVKQSRSLFFHHCSTRRRELGLSLGDKSRRVGDGAYLTRREGFRTCGG
jgi:hypothetical protein